MPRVCVRVAQGTSKGQAEQISALSAELAALKQTSGAQVALLTTSNDQLTRDLATAQDQVRAPGLWVGEGEGAAGAVMDRC